MSGSPSGTPPSRSPTLLALHSQGGSQTSGRDVTDHTPSTPSRLRNSHGPEESSPEEPRSEFYTPAARPPASAGSSPSPSRSPNPRSRAAEPLVDVFVDSIRPSTLQAEPVVQVDDETSAPANLDPPGPRQENEALAEDEAEEDIHAKLLENYNRTKPGACPPDECEHGILSPRGARTASIRSRLSDLGDGVAQSSADLDFGGRYRGSIAEGPDAAHGLLGDAIADGLLGYGTMRQSERGDSADGRAGSTAGQDAGLGGEGGEEDDPAKERWRIRSGLSTTSWLASSHRVKGSRRMYLAYYIPFLNWFPQYQWAWFKGDLIAALTMASFYIPMSLSYASNLGHIPPINGLYSFVFNPLIYAFLGTSAQMVVGPEAAGSLLVGTVVRSSVEHSDGEDDDMVLQARVAGVVTAIAGAAIFVAGLTRLGFLDSVLSRPFLRGFISAIGFVILVDQLLPELGLVYHARKAGVDHGSSVNKLIFLLQNLHHTHALTAIVSLSAFAIIMVCRFFKQRYQPRRPWVAYIPDRFIVVVFSAVFTYAFDWEDKGVKVLGDVRSATGSAFPFHWPFIPSHMHHIREAMGTSFLIALLGFFESSVAAKAITGRESGAKSPKDGIQGMALSPNRELVALGVANLVGGCFMALPAFGGYGRSKVNASTGGKTPMSSILLSIITIICVLFLMPYFRYLPRGVLSAMISVVAYSLVEECPDDILFFIRVRGWSELFLMFMIFAATILYSLALGIALGMGLSLLAVIRHATKPRIQILGRVPGEDRFENAESEPHHLEFFAGCLIVKIPEPLTFANTGDLRARLRRLELYGTTAAHPALPQVRAPEHNQNVIFDVHGVTGLDASGAQVLAEIVESYRNRGVRVFFCRVPPLNSSVFRLFVRSGIVENCGGMSHFVKSVDEALRMAEEATTSDDDELDESLRGSLNV